MAEEQKQQQAPAWHVGTLTAKANRLGWGSGHTVYVKRALDPNFWLVFHSSMRSHEFLSTEQAQQWVVIKRDTRGWPVRYHRQDDLDRWYHNYIND